MARGQGGGPRQFYHDRKTRKMNEALLPPKEDKEEDQYTCTTTRRQGRGAIQFYHDKKTMRKKTKTFLQ